MSPSTRRGHGCVASRPTRPSAALRSFSRSVHSSFVHGQIWSGRMKGATGFRTLRTADVLVTLFALPTSLSPYSQGPKTDTREARAFAEACRLGAASTTLTNYRKDGSPFTHRIRSRRVLDASGRVYYLSEGREVHGVLSLLPSSQVARLFCVTLPRLAAALPPLAALYAAREVASHASDRRTRSPGDASGAPEE